MKNLSRIEQPTDEPITLIQAKLFLRETNSDEDAYIAALISMAREAVEDYTRRALIEQTWRLTMDSWYASSSSLVNPLALFTRNRRIELDRSPLISVESVKYWPSDGTAQVTMSTSDYIVAVGLFPGLICLKKDVAWPDLYERPDAVTIDFTAGDVEQMPLRAVQAIYLTLANYYENRVPVVQGTIVAEVPDNAKWMLQNLKVSGFVA